MYFNPKDFEYTEKDAEIGLVNLPLETMKEYAQKASRIRSDILWQAETIESLPDLAPDDGQKYITQLEKRIFLSNRKQK